NTLTQHAIRVFECERDLRRTPGCHRWVGDAPVRRHRLAWPDGARFTGSVVANGESEIERRSARSRKLAPRFRTKRGCVIPQALEQPSGFWVNDPFRLAACAVRSEFADADLV